MSETTETPQPESIAARLDREAKRLAAVHPGSLVRQSDAFISGIEHAANIASRMGHLDPAVLTDLRKVLTDDRETLLADAEDATGWREQDHLKSKAEGVRLAMSEVDGIRRENGVQS